MKSDNPGAQKSESHTTAPTGRRDDDRDSPAAQAETHSKEQIGGGLSAGESSGCGTENPTDEDTLLPDSWDAVDAEPAYDLPQTVTPRDLDRASRGADTLLDVTTRLRTAREPTRRSLARLGLGDRITPTRPHDLLGAVDPDIVTDGGTVQACPECDNTGIWRRRGGMVGVNATAGDPDAEFRCKRCGATFDDPTERHPHSGSRGPREGTVAKRLADADPDDLVTDGGTTAYDVGLEGRGHRTERVLRQRAAHLSAFQQHILYILVGEPRYGLAIKDELQDLYGEEINHGRLYPNLDTLVEAGFIDKSERDKRTNEYALSDEGERLLEADLAWRSDRLGAVDGGDDA